MIVGNGQMVKRMKRMKEKKRRDRDDEVVCSWRYGFQDEYSRVNRRVESGIEW